VSDERPAPGTDLSDSDEGGNAACWLNQVCPSCGRLGDGPRPDRCPVCGAPLAEEA
jgi:uncharacterized protein